MNDRYLFKAKRTDNGEWMEGGLITGVFFRLGQDIPYILCPDKADYDCFEDFSEENGIFEVDPSTICQCTGLKDKNGKLIWENDIVKHFYNKDEPERYDIGVVQWDDVHLRFKRTSKTDEKCVGISFYSVYEVIGSAFDNLELLEVGE